MGLIKKPSELQVQTTIKALLYGQPGIGKTTDALSAPAFTASMSRTRPPRFR